MDGPGDAQVIRRQRLPIWRIMRAEAIQKGSLYHLNRARIGIPVVPCGLWQRFQRIIDRLTNPIQLFHLSLMWRIRRAAHALACQ